MSLGGTVPAATASVLGVTFQLVFQKTRKTTDTLVRSMSYAELKQMFFQYDVPLASRTLWSLFRGVSPTCVFAFVLFIWFSVASLGQPTT